MVYFSRILPLLSFTIGSTALLFQVGVLYPWHHELDKEFRELKNLKLKEDFEMRNLNVATLASINALESKVDLIIARNNRV